MTAGHENHQLGYGLDCEDEKDGSGERHFAFGYELPVITNPEWWLTRPLILGLSVALTVPMIWTFRRIRTRLGPPDRRARRIGGQAAVPIVEPAGQEARW